MIQVTDLKTLIQRVCEIVEIDFETLNPKTDVQVYWDDGTWTSAIKPPGEPQKRRQVLKLHILDRKTYEWVEAELGFMH